MFKRKSSEQIATLEKEKIRQHELEVAEIEAAKVKAANDATVSPMSQKHDFCRKMADREARTGFPIVSAGPAFAAVLIHCSFLGINKLLNPFPCRCIYIVKWIDMRDEPMQTKKLATVFTVGALIALLVTLGSVQSAFAGGRSGPKVTTHAGPQNPGDGPQSGGGNDPLGGSISGPRITSGSPGLTAGKQPQDKLPGKKKP